MEHRGRPEYLTSSLISDFRIRDNRVLEFFSRQCYVSAAHATASGDAQTEDLVKPISTMGARAATLLTAPVYGSHKDRNIQLRSLTMTRRWLIFADDLTGAADCAIAFCGRGLAAVVTWGDIGNVRTRQKPILAYDIASRGLSVDAAIARHRDLLASQPVSGRLFFKKIDFDLAGAASSGDCGDARMSGITIGFGIWSACSGLSCGRPHDQGRPHPGQWPCARGNRPLATRP